MRPADRSPTLLRAALAPYGRALRDYHAGAQDAVLIVHSDLGEHDEMPVGLPEISWPSRSSDYPGEAWIRLEYRGDLGPPFRELYVDRGTLTERATGAGWKTEIVFEGDAGGYVARLR